MTPVFEKYDVYGLDVRRLARDGIPLLYKVAAPMREKDRGLCKLCEERIAAVRFKLSLAIFPYAYVCEYCVLKMLADILKTVWKENNFCPLQCEYLRKNSKHIPKESGK
jgi:hypothetical protein